MNENSDSWRCTVQQLKDLIAFEAAEPPEECDRYWERWRECLVAARRGLMAAEVVACGDRNDVEAWLSAVQSDAATLYDAKMKEEAA